MFNQDLLTAFCEQFYGYGDLSAPVWFIGMEEGGGATHQEVVHRLTAWHDLGRPPTADVHDFHARTGVGNHLDVNEAVEGQSTWRQLIRTVLAGTGIEPGAVDKRAIARYQVDCFARKDSLEAVLELMPLPSPSVKEWRYAAWAGEMSYLATRKAYLRRFLEIRKTGLRHMLAAHAGLRAVIFHGFKYQAEYEQIAGVRLVTKPFATPVRHGGRIFMLLPHPVARAVSGEGPAEWYAAAGKVLRDHGVFANGHTRMCDGVSQQARRSVIEAAPL